MTIGNQGLGVSASDGSYYDSVIVKDGGNAVRVIPEDVKTGSVAIKGYSIDDEVYLGWDDDVDGSNGFPLTEGDVMALDINNDGQGIWMYSDTDLDEIRVIATN